jgi:hypothetical protein
MLGLGGASWVCYSKCRAVTCGCRYPFAGHRDLHFSVLRSAHPFGAILRTTVNLGKAVKLTYAKILKCISMTGEGIAPVVAVMAAGMNERRRPSSEAEQNSSIMQSTVRFLSLGFPP